MTTPEEMIDCERGGIYLLSRWIRDHKPFAMLSVADVLARSSNVGTIKVGLRLSPETAFTAMPRVLRLRAADGTPLAGRDSRPAAAVGALASGCNRLGGRLAKRWV